ncbi:hypothetical protein N1F78_05565 [Seonamhaeicola sp. MEBiC1930]|uniref:hypothetical protein n=1 Tax=Seonamhaeicola sp. MEBiC01930 TaxID=2976768 RepID=UPI003253A041
MSKRIISIFFCVIFTAFLTAPTIITLVDDSVDISVFYTSAEEEEKGHEKNKDTEKLFFEILSTETAFAFSNMDSELEYFYKKYSKPHLNLISPPPRLA